MHFLFVLQFSLLGDAAEEDLMMVRFSQLGEKIIVEIMCFVTNNQRWHQREQKPIFYQHHSVWTTPKKSSFYTHIVRNLHFLSKNSTLISRKKSWKCCGLGLFSCWQLWFHEKNCQFFWVKNSWKCCGFGLFSCWQLWFHEKNCQKKFGWKTRENVGVLSKLNFWTKIWLFE